MVEQKAINMGRRMCHGSFLSDYNSANNSSRQKDDQENQNENLIHLKREVQQQDSKPILGEQIMKVKVDAAPF